ncbi:MAG: alpha/beta hydrolase fold domain-containing protein [Pseudomonadota bacterium]|nr:alpha/beta hydrolase fold domain-containing protein [Pseudomonadota bacterium]
MRIVIVGGGIGGLTAALALRHHGIEAIVLERAAQLSEIGAGIQIAANGTLVLRELGLEPALAAVATVPERYDYRDLATGRLLYLAPLGQEAAGRYGALMYNVHRADLIDLLYAALPPGAVRLGAECATIAQDARQARVTLRTGEVIEADAVIGADGIHSVVRTALRGPEDKQFANILMWRALIPKAKLEGLPLPVAGNNWFGTGRNVISYWVRPDLYSILAAVPATEVRRESWTESGDIGELLDSFQGAEPTIQAMLGAVESSFITGMYYRDPIPNWSTGRITLLGDAAHAMVPYLAQGACQSIEDAWVLAVCLKKHGAQGIEAALLEYERRRQPRTTRIQAGARFAVKMAHEPDEDSVRWRNGRWRGLARIDPLAETSWAFAWGHDILAAAKLPPGEVVGLSAAREGKRMARPESQRAFDLWKGAIGSEDIARGHLGQRAAYERFLFTHFPAPADLAVAPAELNGVRALRVGAGADDAAVLHFHGGAYVMGSAASSAEYAGRLSRAFGAPCYCVDYRLAPEHPYPAAIDDAFDAYRGLLATGVAPQRIVLSGESSGAGLALALAMALRRAGLPLPGGVFAICPFTDLTLGGPTVQLHSGDDPAAHRDSLTQLAASYFQGHEPTDPMVSPLFGDPAGLPPLYIAVVDGEVLQSDGTRFADKARAAGVDVTLRVVPDSVHVFTLFPFLPEAQDTLEDAGRWLRARLQDGARTAQAA